MDKHLTRHSEENLRCLIAVSIVLAGSIGAYVLQRTRYPTAPVWMPFAVFGVLLAVVTYLFSLRRSTTLERVSADERRIVRTLPDGRAEAVSWDDLKEVVVVTTDEGPEENEDIYWMLVGYTGGLTVGGGAVGIKEFQSRLQRLPKFSHSAVARAMGSKRNSSFVCWRRDL